MSAHTKEHHTDKRNIVEVVIYLRNQKHTSHISKKDVPALKKFLKEHLVNQKKSFDWKEHSKDRIDKHKKAGIVLRGARYREGMSQKELAEKSSVSQNDISKIENGKRTVGEKVAKRLAKVLNINHSLLIEN